jgi:hypothetical protein
MRTARLAGAAGVVAVVGVVACSRAEAPPEAAPAAEAARPAVNPRFLADDLPLLPDGVLFGARPPEVIRASYAFAARHPDVLRYVPCFCGCERAGHKGSHDCFVASRASGGRVTAWDSHGITCAVCIDVAYSAMQMHNSGASVPAIRTAIDTRYKSDGHAHGYTPTPMPPRGGSGGSHD